MMTSSFHRAGLSAAIVATLFIRAAAQTASSSTVASGASPTPHAAKVKPKSEAKTPSAHDIAWQKLIANVRSQGKKEVNTATGLALYSIHDSDAPPDSIGLHTSIALAERDTSGKKWVNAQLIYTESYASTGYTFSTVFNTNGSGHPTIIHEYTTQDERDGSTTTKDLDDPPFDINRQALFNRMLKHWAERKP